MSRKNRSYIRSINPDSRYDSERVAKFVNYLMHHGKKSVAEAVLYGSFDIIEKKIKKSPLEVFDAAIRNVSPAVEIKARRVGGANYQVPVEVRGERRFTLASRWLLDAARSKKGAGMPERLATELIDASKKEGAAMKKRADVHRMAEANRAFAHFA